jgi:hypothetical protein
MEFGVIPRYPDHEVSTSGRVFSYRRKQRRGLKGTIDHYGYRVINLLGKRWKVHTLVLLTFVGPRPKGMGCRHLDGNRLNNRLSNLSWGTQTQNMKDCIKHGRTTKGERGNKSDLTDDDIRKIRKIMLTSCCYEGRRKRKNGVVRNLAKRFGVSVANIYMIARKEVWSHVH